MNIPKLERYLNVMFKLFTVVFVPVLSKKIKRQC